MVKRALRGDLWQAIGLHGIQLRSFPAVQKQVLTSRPFPRLGSAQLVHYGLGRVDNTWRLVRRGPVRRPAAELRVARDARWHLYLPPRRCSCATSSCMLYSSPHFRNRLDGIVAADVSPRLKSPRFRLGRHAARLSSLPRGLGLVWSAAPGWTLLWFSVLVVQGLLPAVSVLLTRRVVDELVVVVSQGATWEALRPVLVPAVLLGGLILLAQLLTSVGGYIRTAQAELVQDHIAALVHRQSVALDLSFYDSATYYDHLHRARSEASYRPMELLENLGNLVQNGITLGAMAVVLIPYGVWVPVALLVSTLPALYVVLRYSRREHRWQLQTTPDQRYAWYTYWLLTAREVAAELRLFDLGDHFQSAYQVVRQRLRGQRLALQRSEMPARLAAGAAALLVAAPVLLWMLLQAAAGLATLGDLTLFYQAFTRGQGLMRSLLESLGQIYSNSLFLGNLFEFLALQPTLADPPHPKQAPMPLTCGLRFEGVSFRYPGSDEAILDGFDLDVPANHIVAIVGPNGAGKSTLIKLVCRLYDPDSGCIRLEGIDLRNLKLVDLRQMITALFQEPVRYSATAGENIALSRLGAASVDEIAAAARAAGAHDRIARLPQGYDTRLGTLFEGGTELSVGEWQRVALARALLRPAPVIILDEPTSFMDSWAEVEWLQRFRQIAAGRTVVLITHRFTTAMYADLVYVMDQGRIVESGSHEQLVALGGSYARSWKAQMQQQALPTIPSASEPTDPSASPSG